MHLKGYEFGKIFRMVSRNGGVEYWTTNDMGLTEKKRKVLYIDFPINFSFSLSENVVFSAFWGKET